MPGGPADPSQVTWKPAEGAALHYRARKLQLAGLTAAALLRLWDHVQNGVLTEDDMVTMGATSVAAANTQAATLADLYLAHLLELPPLGLTVLPDTDRLSTAILTAASDQGTNPTDALTRLGRAEPLSTAQSTLQTGMRDRQVSGWTRVTGGSPCQMCADLANGAVLPVSVDMATHPGCSCSQSPVSD